MTTPSSSAPTSDGRRAQPGVYRPGYEVVAEQIAQLKLSPGDRMPTEKDLAARLGSSRTVVREAVKILSAAGRVSAQSRHTGPIVPGYPPASRSRHQSRAVGVVQAVELRGALRGGHYGAVDVHCGPSG